MGNALKCQACTPAVNHSIFYFSEDLVYKITEGRPQKGLTAAQMKALNKNGDSELFNELRCIDDSHTIAYGLTPSRVELLLSKLEETVSEMAVDSTFGSDVVKFCYKTNKDQPIKCADRITEFDELVDEKCRSKLDEIIKKQ